TSVISTAPPTRPAWPAGSFSSSAASPTNPWPPTSWAPPSSSAACSPERDCQGRNPWKTGKHGPVQSRLTTDLVCAMVCASEGNGQQKSGRNGEFDLQFGLRLVCAWFALCLRFGLRLPYWVQSKSNQV